MKRILGLIVVMLAIAFALASCGESEPTVEVNEDGSITLEPVG